MQVFYLNAYGRYRCRNRSSESEEINVAYVEGRKFLHIHGYVGHVEVNTSQSHFVESPRGFNKREQGGEEGGMARREKRRDEKGGDIPRDW
jgi:hypothetical protein